MENNTIYQQKDRSWIADVLFYLAFAALALVVFFYAVFFLKAQMQFNQIAKIDEKISAYGTSEQKEHEQQIHDYKKRIDDFAGLLENHGMSSNIFSFLEANTLAGVVFSGFTLSGPDRQMRLSGEAQDMQTLGRQFGIFEASKEYVDTITVFNSQTLPSKKTAFVFNLSLKPKMFEYHFGQ